MERKCPIECGTFVRVLEKPIHPVEISASSLTTHIKLKHFRSFFSILLVRTIILKVFYLFFGVLAAFYKFHWKVYATLTMRNGFLGVQISIIWVVFAVRTVTLLWQPAKTRDIARECHSSSHLLWKLIIKGPQLSWKQTFYS